jgi:hypothetical protein
MAKTPSKHTSADDDWPPPLGDPRWFTAADRLKFLDELAKNGGDAVNALLTAAPNVSVLTLHNTLKRDKDFAALYEDSLEASTMVLRSAAVDRGVRGTPVVKYGKDENGNEVVEAKSFDPSDKLLEAELKARRPDLYSDKQRVEVTGKDGGAIAVKSALVTDILGLLERAARPRVSSKAPPPSASKSKK